MAGKGGAAVYSLTMPSCTLGGLQGDQFNHTGAVFECDGLKKLEEAVPAQEADPDPVQGVHESGVAVEVVDLPCNFHEHPDTMKVGGVLSNPGGGLNLSLPDRNADPLPKLGREHTVIGP